MISSPSAQIVNAIAESRFINGPGGERVPAYGPTMAVATAIIATGIAVTASLGPEKRGSRFENAVIGGQTAVVSEKEADLERGDSVDHTKPVADEKAEIVENAKV